MNYRIPQINFLRGIAILLVIYQHVFASFLSQELGTTVIIDNGWIGVNLFFILSGFVLYKPYVDGKRSFKISGSVAQFYIARIRRLVPLLVFSVLVAILFVYGGGSEYLLSAFLVVTTLSMVTVTNFIPVINGPLWSLVVEVWFSVLFPFLVKLVNRFGLKRVVVVVFILSFIIRLLGSAFPYEYLSINPLKDIFLARLDDFVLGMAIAHIYVSNKPFLEVVRKNTIWLVPFSMIALLAGIFMFELVGRGDLALPFVSMMNTLFQIGFGIFTLVSLSSVGRLKSLLSIYPIRFLGAICYSVYIWHVLLIPTLLPYMSLLNLAIYFIGLLSFSLMTFRYVEYTNYSWKTILTNI